MANHMPVSGLPGLRHQCSSAVFFVCLWTKPTNFDVPGVRLKQIFDVLIFIMTVYKIYTLVC